jgi:pantoate--beta-alanine ligase
MKILRTIQEMQAASRELRKNSRRIGFVPTMGALHAGHISLMKAAKLDGDVAVASIFVNPTQFGPNEDFDKYPRTFDRDCELLEGVGVDLLFAPSVGEMYPVGAATYATVESLGNKLDGVSRPGHFRGVTTVVAKLFNIVQPDAAFFGQKDAAQVAVIRRMVRDLNFPVKIVACPIVRESDGLAMSSRNVYLSQEQRKTALALCHSLKQVERNFREGERDSVKLAATGKQFFDGESAKLDYFSIVDPDSLEEIQTIDRPALAAVAAYVGATRLIDNVLLTP